jgi:hypothetical protein
MVGEPSSQADDPVAVLRAYATFSDQRGGGIETAFKGDKQGLGWIKRNKKRFEAQQIVLLLGSLVHNVLIWARRWLALAQVRPVGLLRLVRDVFHISGLLGFDASGSLVQIVLNQDAHLAHRLVHSFRELLAPSLIVVNLGET